MTSIWNFTGSFGCSTASSDSETMAKTKVWAKRSYETANLIVTFGYWIGALPVKWNKAKSCMEPIHLKRDIARWLITILFVITLEMAIALNFILRWVSAEDPLAFVKRDPYRLIVIGISGIGAFVHAHTAWKYRQFAAFINRAAGFYEFFQSNYAKKEEHRGYTKEDTISGQIKFAFLFGMNIFGGFFVFAYLIRCRRHVLFYVVPICNSQYPMYTEVLVKILGSAVQFMFTVVNLSGISLYVDLFAAVVLMGLYIVREMSGNPGGRRTTRKLFKPKPWFHGYRCLQLIVQELNDCIGEIFMPVHMLFVVVASCGAVVILVRYEVGSMITLTLVVSLSAFGGYYRLLIGRGSNFCQASSHALLFMAGKMNKPNLRRRHRSCPVLKPAVGGLFPLTQHTVTTMFLTSVEMTSDFLLL